MVDSSITISISPIWQVSIVVFLLILAYICGDFRSNSNQEIKFLSKLQSITWHLLPLLGLTILYVAFMLWNIAVSLPAPEYIDDKITNESDIRYHVSINLATLAAIGGLVTILFTAIKSFNNHSMAVSAQEDTKLAALSLVNSRIQATLELMRANKKELELVARFILAKFKSCPNKMPSHNGWMRIIQFPKTVAIRNQRIGQITSGTNLTFKREAQVSLNSDLLEASIQIRPAQFTTYCRIISA